MQRKLTSCSSHSTHPGGAGDQHFRGSGGPRYRIAGHFRMVQIFHAFHTRADFVKIRTAGKKLNR